MGRPSIVPKHFLIGYPLGPAMKYSKPKNVRSERDVVAVRDFPTSNHFKTIPFFTCRKSPRVDDHLPIGYSLPDFQLIWNNFKIEILQLQIALNQRGMVLFFPGDHIQSPPFLSGG